MPPAPRAQASPTKAISSQPREQLRRQRRGQLWRRALCSVAGQPGGVDSGCRPDQLGAVRGARSARSGRYYRRNRLRWSGWSARSGWRRRRGGCDTGAQGPAGATGSAGPEGPQGPAGTAGLQGPIGLTGPQGPQGVAGRPAAGAGFTDKGNFVLNHQLRRQRRGQLWWRQLCGVVGQPGGVDSGCRPDQLGAVRGARSEGPAGTTGATGSAGPAGPQGPAGADGASGCNGCTRSGWRDRFRWPRRSPGTGRHCRFARSDRFDRSRRVRRV